MVQLHILFLGTESFPFLPQPSWPTAVTVACRCSHSHCVPCSHMSHAQSHHLMLGLGSQEMLPEWGHRPPALLHSPFAQSRWRREGGCWCCCTAISPLHESKLGCVPGSPRALRGRSCSSAFPGAHSRLRVSICTSSGQKTPPKAV